MEHNLTALADKAKTSVEPKPHLCVDCTFHSVLLDQHKCDNPRRKSRISPITGEIEYEWNYCLGERGVTGMCGPEGKLWKPRQ